MGSSSRAIPFSTKESFMDRPWALLASTSSALLASSAATHAVLLHAWMMDRGDLLGAR